MEIGIQSERWMQKPMWNRVKETILYLRSKGLRVDGIGWQGHLGLSRSTLDFIEKPERLLKLFLIL